MQNETLFDGLERARDQSPGGGGWFCQEGSQAVWSGEKLCAKVEYAKEDLGTYRSFSARGWDGESSHGTPGATHRDRGAEAGRNAAGIQ